MPAPDLENLERLATALIALDAHPTDFGPSAPTPSAEQLHIAPIVPPLTTRHGDLHILNDVPGASAYDGMRNRALTTDLDGIAVHIVSVDDLIRMKKKAGRPNDIEDIEALTAVAQREARSDDGASNRGSSSSDSRMSRGKSR